MNTLPMPPGLTDAQQNAVKLGHHSIAVLGRMTWTRWHLPAAGMYRLRQTWCGKSYAATPPSTQLAILIKPEHRCRRCVSWPDYRADPNLIMGRPREQG